MIVFSWTAMAQEAGAMFLEIAAILQLAAPLALWAS
jgi:hypothetical protein